MNERRALGTELQKTKEKLVLAEEEWQQLVAHWLPLLPLLTQHLQDASGQIENAVNQICERFDSIAARTQQCADLGASSNAQAGASGGRSSLEPAANQTADVTLDRDIAQLVMALQFQDAVSQRLTEVSGALTELATVLTVWRDLPPGSRQGQEGGGYDKWVERLTRFACPTDKPGEAAQPGEQPVGDHAGYDSGYRAITLFD